jgi:tRNA pseudouridine38-40 synthase
MPRYKLLLEYNGSNYAGWQIQPNISSIQGKIQEAIKCFCQETTTVYGSGRTDAGVHALGQVAHFDLLVDKDPNELFRALNYYLRGSDISVLNATKVSDEFHARFSASGREYRYDIINRYPPSPLKQGLAWHVRFVLDIESMKEAASLLVGTHDFASFRSIECQSKSSIKTIDHITLERIDDIISIKIGARSFLHNQVRIIVGTLVEIGSGRRDPSDINRLLLEKDRKQAGPTAPPHGLYFLKASY